MLILARLIPSVPLGGDGRVSLLRNQRAAREADEVYEVICRAGDGEEKEKGRYRKWKREERIDLWIVREGSGFL